jgi:hypothetical protein
LGDQHVRARADHENRVGGLRGDHRALPDLFVSAFGWGPYALAMSVIFKNSPLGITANKLNKAFKQSGGGTGSGDMTKAVYDADGNGIVDTADSIPWSKVTGKPPALGDMTKAVYDTNNDGISDHAALADAAPWAGITGRPATFPPDSTAMLKATYDVNGDGITDHAALADSAPWVGISGKPSTFPPDSSAELVARKGQVNGYAGLDGSGKVPVAQLPPFGTGDMLKSVYDTNGDGISDHAALADAAPWTGITGKPATFPPDSTAMLKSVYDINGNNVVDTCDSLAYAKLTGVPATFTPMAHFATHLDNGTDPIPVATTSRTGSLRILNGTATTFLDGTGNWSVPAPNGLVNPGIWTALTYSTGWTQNTTAQFRVETNGSFQKVICQGIINYASGAASLAFTLPVGARPGVARGCVVAGFDSSGDTQLFQATISTAGAVNIVPMVRQNFSWPSATNGSVYLDNLVFSL